MDLLTAGFYGGNSRIALLLFATGGVGMLATALLWLVGPLLLDACDFPSNMTRDEVGARQRIAPRPRIPLHAHAFVVATRSS